MNLDISLAKGSPLWNMFDQANLDGQMSARRRRLALQWGWQPSNLFGNGLETTSDQDLRQLAKDYDIDLEIFMVKDLKKIKKVKTCIINADDENRGGTHWVCAFSGPEQHYTIFFDPFGAAIDERIRKYLKQGEKDVIALTTQAQHLHASSCGYWCIYFLYSMSMGMTPANFLARLDPTDQQKNEKLLEIFFNKNNA